MYKMRYVLVLLLLGCLVSGAIGRPSHMDNMEDSEVEEAEYDSEVDDGEAEEAEEDDESKLGGQEPTMEDQNQELKRRENNKVQFASHENEPQSKDSSDLAGYKLNRNEETAFEKQSVDLNNQYNSPAQPRDTNNYNEKNDLMEQADSLQNFLNHDENMKPRNEKSSIDKRTAMARTVSSEEGDLLFEHNENVPQRQENTNKVGLNRARDSVENPRFIKKYYNSIHDVDAGDKRDGDLNLNRDRRAVQETNETLVQASLVNSEGSLDKNSAEDEESAIKRHVKKLSDTELTELLNSLSDDKRELLKKIMDSDYDKDDINKREITKKAGAAPDDNTYLEGGQADNSKLQEGGSGAESNSQNVNTEATETSKQPNSQSDINVLPAMKQSEISNETSLSAVSENKAETKIELNPQDSEVISGKPEGAVNTGSSVLEPSNPIKIEVQVQEQPKTETKRETNLNDLSNADTSFEDDARLLDNSELSLRESQDSSNDANFYGSQDKDLEFEESEGQQKIEGQQKTMSKREAYSDKDSELSDSMKSLEESFPNSNSYDEDDPYSESDMAPLVRVKRKNLELALKKRAAGIIPDAKVAYFPYRAENDDEDNDEGNEFDDDGFYDRTSNLAKNNVKETPTDEEPASSLDDSFPQLTSSENDKRSSKLSQDSNVESDTSLGSDSDGVISGIEGVDDNLMFNNPSRNRRANEEDPKIRVAPENLEATHIRLMRSTPLLDDEMKSVSSNTVNSQNYHENDAFGPLPRNYEGELGRYKRIRRVKQPPAPEEPASNT